MSLYADYLTERTDDHIIECESGFVTYRYLNAEQVYIMDIYTKPKHRKRGAASDLANLVCNEARVKGCKELVGTVNPSCRGANESILTLIAYGMKVSSSSDNIIFFKKEL